MADRPGGQISLQDVSHAIDGNPVLNGVSVQFERAELVTLLGPNGAGKTSLLRAALGMIRPDHGYAEINGHDSAAMNPAQRARTVAYLPQTRPLAWPISVYDLVALGRFAWGATSGSMTSSDSAPVENALQQCSLTTLARRRTDELSGGELARAHCARALASEAPFLVADEPIAALDPQHQIQIMQLLRELADAGHGVVLVLHDIGMAARYSDRLVWLNNGRIVANGSPKQTLSEARIAQVFKVNSRVSTGSDGKSRVDLTGVI